MSDQKCDSYTSYTTDISTQRTGVACITLLCPYIHSPLSPAL